MIGDGWDGDPAARPGPEPRPASRRRIAVITGSRADFGLLQPVMRAVQTHPKLELAIIAAGAHLIQPANTYRDVKLFAAELQTPIADAVPMQTAGKTGRLEDAEALGAGVSRFARAFGRLRPDWVVVLGDRIEAFAAASAASVGGIALAHIHGGDRAEGVADEAMRHAITKLAHLHLAATAQSAERIKRMGERPEHIHTVGSPALDGLDAVPPLADEAFAGLGSPDTVFLMHPVGRTDEAEEHVAATALGALAGRRVIALEPNADPGRTGIARAIATSAVRSFSHIPRERFVGLLKRLAASRGVLVGNSSAALIEAAALGVRAVDIGPRQAGRERFANVVTAADESGPAVARALAAALALDPSPVGPGLGDGRAGPRIAALLAATDPHDERLLRKRCAY